MVNYAMAIDLEKCIGCMACVVACKTENKVPIGIFRLRIEEEEHGTFPHLATTFMPKQCMHCDNPPCVTVCPTRASYRTKDGIVRIDRKKCIGCRACIIACPYDARVEDHEGGFIDKCTFCDHLVDQGKQPACVETCPTGSRIFGRLDDPNSKLRTALNRNHVEVLKVDAGTRPKVFFLNSTRASASTQRNRVLQSTNGNEKH